jgi:transcriptional regulator NrdR family protein
MKTHLHLLPWQTLLSWIEGRRTFNRQKLLDTLREEATKREEQARGLRKAIAQIETESWENEDR